MNELEKLNGALNSLVIFRSLGEDPVMARLRRLLAAAALPPARQAAVYADFAHELFQYGDDLTGYILERVLEDDNLYTVKRSAGQPVGDILEECLIKELAVLQQAAALTPAAVRAALQYDGYLPPWRSHSAEFLPAYRERMERIPVCGTGIFSRYRMFMAREGRIDPIESADPIRLTDLIGYEKQRQAVVDNTLALLRGKPAANVLLYGDAGTGKSSTVKAIVNEYAAEGLRLIEIPKNQYGSIPAVTARLSGNPLKFILFIDDLSFTQENDDFNAMKAILEGSVWAKAPNLAVYATSNRRHLVRELFSEREGDDIHRNETMQELGSLSDRFGLWVSFFRPGKDQYLEIVRGLRDQYGVTLADDELDAMAERYAIGRAGRSPRIARQFVESLLRMDP